MRQRVRRHADRCAYDRQPRGHGFDDRAAEPFIQAWEDEHIGFEIEPRQRRLINTRKNRDSLTDRVRKLRYHPLLRL